MQLQMHSRDIMDGTDECGRVNRRYIYNMNIDAV